MRRALQLLRLAQIDRERPFAEHRHARVQGGQRELAMPGDLDGDDDEVDVLVLRELPTDAYAGTP